MKETCPTRYPGAVEMTVAEYHCDGVRKFSIRIFNDKSTIRYSAIFSILGDIKDFVRCTQHASDLIIIFSWK